MGARVDSNRRNTVPTHLELRRNSNTMGGLSRKIGPTEGQGGTTTWDKLMASSRYLHHAIVFFSVIALAAVGCSRTAPEGDAPVAESATSAADAAASDAQPSGAAKSLTVAVIPKSTGGEFWETVELGSRAAGENLGVAIKWEGALAETEIAEQKKIIENMVNLGVDGIALAPLNATAMRKSVGSAVAEGIPVVIFDSSVEGDAHTSYVATNNEAGGALGGQHMVEKLAGTAGRTIVQRYIQGTASTEDRARGFMDTAKAGGLKVLADPYPEDSTVAGCKKTSTNTLESFVKDGKLELDGVFACNLTATQGMLAALDGLRKSGVQVNVVFVGFDTSPMLIKDLQAGNIDALVAQDPETMGFLAVDTLVRHLRGEEVDAVIDTGVELVTRERLENDLELRKLVGLE